MINKDFGYQDGIEDKQLNLIIDDEVPQTDLHKKLSKKKASFAINLNPSFADLNKETPQYLILEKEGLDAMTKLNLEIQGIVGRKNAERKSRVDVAYLGKNMSIKEISP